MKRSNQKQVSQLTKTISKHQSKRVKSTELPQAPKGKTGNYDILKAALSPIIYEANVRIEALEASGFESYALQKMKEETGGSAFNIDNKQKYEDIIAEATRARVFLMDKTSTVQGAEDYTRQLSYAQYIGEFGNNYNNFENKYKRYNIQLIDENYARFAFKAYRMLEETEQARIMEFGSDTMIAAMYDMVIKSGYNDGDSTNQLMDIVEQASDFLDREVGYKKDEFKKLFDESNAFTSMLDIVKLRGKEYYERYDF